MFRKKREPSVSEHWSLPQSVFLFIKYSTNSSSTKTNQQTKNPENKQKITEQLPPQERKHKVISSRWSQIKSQVVAIVFPSVLSPLDPEQQWRIICYPLASIIQQWDRGRFNKYSHSECWRMGNKESLVHGNSEFQLGRHCDVWGWMGWSEEFLITPWFCPLGVTPFCIILGLLALPSTCSSWPNLKWELENTSSLRPEQFSQTTSCL